MRDIGRISAAAFRNAVRLHTDAVLLHGNGRYPSAFQLSVLSQEEIGKTFLLEEFAFRVNLNERDSQDTGKLLADLLSHQSKQYWFTRQEFDMSMSRVDSRISRLMKEAQSGVLEARKQDAAYVGLSRNRKGKPDPNGRLMTPVSRIRKKHAAVQITRVSDVLVWLTEGYVRGFIGVDTDELESCFTRKLAVDLQELWTERGRSAEQALARWRLPPRNGQ